MKARPSATPADTDGQDRLAVLIDADNAQATVIEGLLAEIARYGVASVRRIYGDFTSTRLTKWKPHLLQHSIQPVQQFAYTSGKNATDSSLIIDAMDLMYTGRFDGFCLVSSDSDFTRLAQRLREEGLTVYGFGERKTPDPFVQACDRFVYTEVLRGEPAAPPARQSPTPRGNAAGSGADAGAGQGGRTAGRGGRSAATQKPAADAPADKSASPVALLRQAIEEASDEEGWAQLGEIGSYLGKLRPDFDPRLYGHRKLSDLVKQFRKEFQVEERATAGGSVAVYVRMAP